MVNFEKCSLRPLGKSFDPVEAYDEFSIHELSEMLKLVGYKNIDIDVPKSMSNPLPMKKKDLNTDNEHRVVFEKGESSMPNIGEDEDVMVHEDNIIKDVQVNMGDFRRTYNKNAEWEGFTRHQVENNDDFEDEELNLEYFDSETDYEGDVEAERNKALRKKFGDKSLVLKMVSKVAVEQRRQLHVYKNDKFRVRVKCNSQTPVFKTFNDVNPAEECGSVCG
ncbi:hypothetical protein Tco_0318465 [Tanacetum coccineum]